jgi:2-oxoisovalerate dehydrogenase E2 component (dihydrolipoyl transacylase)
MAKEFLLPELAESVVEGEIVRWIVAEGQSVKRDDPIIEVMSDKVTVELPSPYTGILEKHLVKEGDVVPVNTPIARIAEEGVRSLSDSVGKRKEKSVQITPSASPGFEIRADDVTQKPVKTLENKNQASDDGDKNSLFQAAQSADNEPVVQIRRGPSIPTSQPKTTDSHGRVLAVPAARSLARELGIDIASIHGSGPNGRVRVEDVKIFAEGGVQSSSGIVGQRAESQSQKEKAVTHHPSPIPFKAIDYKTPQGYEGLEQRLPVRGLRRAISQQMVASHLQSVRTLHVDEADMTELVKLRERLKPFAEKQNVKLSYLPFIMKAVVAALKAFPMVNASLDESTNEIVRKSYYNLGMAVAMEAGLVVPVLHDVDKKSVLELAKNVQDLAVKARDNKLTSEDVKGGTFSITNIGSLGGLFSFPIINVPEAAILGVHSIKKRPVVLDDDSIVARQMVYLSLSFDHRIVDGAEAAMFTSYLIELLENPERLIL